MPILDRDRFKPELTEIRAGRREPTRRRLTELEHEVHDLAGRVDALLEAVGRMARDHYRSPHLPENSLSSALRDAHRR